MNCVMRMSAFCVCENKGADQLPGNCAADQRLCFRYIDSTDSLLPKPLNIHCVVVQPGICHHRGFFFFLRCGPNEPHHLAYAKTKMQISFAVTAKMISAFVFTT